MPNFSDFRRLVLTPGKAEVDQLAAFTMDWVERRGARGKIPHVTITFYPKDDDATNAAADAAQRHSTGANPSGRSCIMADASTMRRSRSEEHTSELQSLMRISYAVLCLKNKIYNNTSTLQH